MHYEEANELLLQPARDEARLALLLNHMIVHDFESLVHLLYRVDVPEHEVKQILQQQPHTDAGLLLAKLLIERQEQKLAVRKQFPDISTNITNEERW